MKFVKNRNILLVGLSLILSLVAFTGVVNPLPSESIKIGLVITNYSDDTSFSIQYQNAIKDGSDSFNKYSVYSFKSFQNTSDLKVITAFKIYTYHTLSLRAEQLHTELYTLSTHKTLYNNFIS